MANITQKAYSTILSGLATELNSLATATYSASGPALGADASTQDLFGDCELVATWGVAPTASTTCDLYLIPSADGTNYADGGGAVAPASGLRVGSFEPRAVTTAQRMVIRDIPLPPGLFKVVLYNGAGQTMVASANTLKIRPHSMQSV